MQNGPIRTHVVAGSIRFEWFEDTARFELVRVPTRPRLVGLWPGIILHREPIAKGNGKGVRAKGNGKGVIDISDDEMNNVLEHDGVIDISSDDDV